MVESAIECAVSANSVDDRVSRNPTNFATAIPRLARSAAMIAFLLPCAAPPSPASLTLGIVAAPDLRTSYGNVAA